MATSARQQGAQGLSSHDADQALQQHTDNIDPQAHGKYSGNVGGQEAKKALSGSRTLGDPVERFNKPLLHLDTPVSASFVTPANISIFSGQGTSLTTQGDAHLTAAHTTSSVSGQTSSLYTHAGGIKTITANATLSLRAHTDAQQIWSDKDLTIQSTTDEIRVQAKDSITLAAGQCQIVLKGGDITFTCPGTWTVKGAMHDWGAGGSNAANSTPLPDSRVKLFDEQIRAMSAQTKQPIVGQRYKISLPDGTTMQDVTDETGKTQRMTSATPEKMNVTWLAPDGQDDFPDVPADEGC